ncbi:hypothetical protein GCM10008905_16580 [Clostridium malenominatum]|uniref:DUF4355 domain-containing protein n=1 Tax=Clostridium malenominatum TaxID=1539 RepID=A0ABN1IXZ0_9CLOT
MFEELNLTEEQLQGVQKVLQSETDKVRTDYTKKIKSLDEELTTLRPKPKTEEEKALEERLKVLEDKEKEITKKEMEFKITETLESNGLPKQLAKYLNMQGAEDLGSYLGEVKEVLNNHILNGSFKPKEHNKNPNVGITKEQFSKMSYAERAELYNTNADLYNRLTSM